MPGTGDHADSVPAILENKVSKPLLTWPLRTIFLSSLLFFCVVPAALVG
jgi:hypothetical protein